MKTEGVGLEERTRNKLQEEPEAKGRDTAAMVIEAAEQGLQPKSESKARGGFSLTRRTCT